MSEPTRLKHGFTREIEVEIEVLVHDDETIEFIRAWDPQTNSPVALTHREIESITTPAKNGQTWPNEYEIILDEIDARKADEERHGKQVHDE